MPASRQASALRPSATASSARARSRLATRSEARKLGILDRRRRHLVVGGEAGFRWLRAAPGRAPRAAGRIGRVWRGRARGRRWRAGPLAVELAEAADDRLEVGVGRLGRGGSVAVEHDLAFEQQLGGLHRIPGVGGAGGQRRRHVVFDFEGGAVVVGQSGGVAAAEQVGGQLPGGGDQDGEDQETAQPAAACGGLRAIRCGHFEAPGGIRTDWRIGEANGTARPDEADEAEAGVWPAVQRWAR